MPLPPSVQTVTVNFGPFTDFQGNAVRGESIFTPSTEVKTDTGVPLVPAPARAVWDAGGNGTVTLPASNSTGLDRTGFTYTVVHRPYGHGIPAPRGGTFLLDAAVPVVDLEDLVKTTTSAGVVVAQPEVVSVAGLTGSPSAQQLVAALGVPLRAAFVPFWAAAENVSVGTVRMSPDGETIVSGSARTTGASWDATEEAAWTVVSSGGTSTPVDAGNLGATYTVPEPAGPDQIVHGVLTANTTITLPPAVAGAQFLLILTQDATGGRTPVFSPVPGYPQNAPVWKLGGNEVNIVQLFCAAKAAGWQALPATTGMAGNFSVDYFSVDVMSKAFSQTNFNTFGGPDTYSITTAFRASSGAVGDQVVFRLPDLNPGTWSIILQGPLNTTRGIITLALSTDAVTWTDVGTFDQYAAAQAMGRVELPAATVPAGTRFLRCRCTGKNASSTGNLVRLAGQISGLRTGA